MRKRVLIAALAGVIVLTALGVILHRTAKTESYQTAPSDAVGYTIPPAPADEPVFVIEQSDQPDYQTDDQVLETFGQKEMVDKAEPVESNVDTQMIPNVSADDKELWDAGSHEDFSESNAADSILQGTLSDDNATVEMDPAVTYDGTEADPISGSEQSKQETDAAAPDGNSPEEDAQGAEPGTGTDGGHDSLSNYSEQGGFVLDENELPLDTD